MALSPEGATCQEEYTANFKGLTEVPDDIPVNSTIVSLYYNNITRIPPNSFSELSLCTNLILGANHLSAIEPGTFNGLTSLHELYLAFNFIDMTVVLIDAYSTRFDCLVQCAK